MDENTITERRHFSMIHGFHLADFFTLTNAACGVAAVFCAMMLVSGQPVRYFLIAAALAPAAFICWTVVSRAGGRRIPRWAANSI